MQQWLGDGSCNGHLHGDAVGGGCESNDSKPGEQQQRGHGTGFGYGACGGIERHVYGHGCGCNHQADRDADCDCWGDFENLLVAAERGDRGPEPEFDRPGLRD